MLDHNYKSLFLLVSTLFIQPLHASENGDGSKQRQLVNESNKSLERIDVYGEKPVHSFLKEFKKHQKDFVASFNKLVEDKEMRVVCDYEAPTPSRIRRINCLPRFIQTHTTKETQWEISRAGGDITDPATLQRTSHISDRRDIQKKLLAEYKAFQKLTVDLLNENPELAATYIKMEDALEKYQKYNKKG